MAGSSILDGNANLKTFFEDPNNKIPKLIVFDLDFTLWPYFICRYYKLPFKKLENDDIVDANNVKVKYFKDVPAILKSLYEFSKTHGFKMAVASRSAGSKIATDLLKALGWNIYLSSIQVYPGNKTRHVKTICSETNVTNLKEILFFDDDPDNIYSVVNYGITSILVNKTKGINWEIIVHGLQKYQQAEFKQTNKMNI